jgi:NOL1/NOP2/sun family putative RNA methylase
MKALINSLAGVAGFRTDAFVQVHQETSPVSVRYNPYKANTSLFVDLHTEPVAWCEWGQYLPLRPTFTLDPHFHAGRYYVQEASSMFLAQAIKQHTDLNDSLRVLDLCAAPGGKSTLIASMLSADSLLVANEVIKSRANILANNLSKWGIANACVTNNDPKDFQRLAGFFDVVVIDAPCSGSGLFRKDPAAQDEWSLANVDLCSQRQKRILADVWDTLKEDGLLIYSTCSYSEAENEEILDWICRELNCKTEQISLQSDWEIVETLSPKYKAYGYRFYPDRVKGEGFFLACLRKNEQVKVANVRPPRDSTKQIKQERACFGNWIDDLEAYTWFALQQDFFLIPTNLRTEVWALQQNLYLRKAGIRLGQMAGKDLIPDHELALSVALTKDIPILSLDKENAISYLRRDDLPPEAYTQQKGWVNIQYEGYGLGWAKVLPNRLNNYYPKDMRILMEG